MSDRLTPEEFRRRQEEHFRKVIEAFPFERIQVSGDQALATWESLARSGRGSPVVIGDDEAFARVAQAVQDLPHFSRPSTQQILETASQTQHPHDLMRQKAEFEAKAMERLSQQTARQPGGPSIDQLKSLFPNAIVEKPLDWLEMAEMSRDREPEMGEWPEDTPGSPGLSVVMDFQTAGPMAAANIVIVPTDDPASIPAHLRWGNWNGCPAPEFHVAALRSWRERYGAELVGLSADVMNIRVTRRPATREEALALAREQYEYCNDIIDQGVGSLSALAAGLMSSDWWFFWWD